MLGVPPSPYQRWSRKVPPYVCWHALCHQHSALQLLGFGFWRPAQAGRHLFSEVMRQDGFDPPAELFPVVRPNALSPITVTTGLGTKQMKERIPISGVAGRNAGFQDLLIKL